MSHKIALICMVALGACAAPIPQAPDEPLIRIRVETKGKVPFERIVSAAHPRADAECGTQGKVARWVTSSNEPNTPVTRVMFACR